jgi:hypothetical protein
MHMKQSLVIQWQESVLQLLTIQKIYFAQSKANFELSVILQ